MAKGDVLDRDRFDAVVGMLQTQKDPGTIRSIRNDLLTHDAALRARIEQAFREGFRYGQGYGMDDANLIDPTTALDADEAWAESDARRALESDHGEQDDDE